MSKTNGHKSIRSVDDISDTYLICRDFGHFWKPYDVTINRKAGEIQRILVCGNCPTQRTQVLTLDGYLIPGRSFYRYPEQLDHDADPYCLKGFGRLSVDDRARIRVLDTNNIKKK